MYAIAPNQQIHHHTVSAKTYIWATKQVDVNEHMTWQQRTAIIAKMANEHGRGAVLSNDLCQLEDLCHRYGGVVQEIRTGHVLGMYTQGYALYSQQDKMDIRSRHIFKNLIYVNGIINDMRVTHVSDGIQNIFFVSCLTDIPEVIELLGERVFTR